MPQERTVECPTCHLPRATKASQGVRLRCEGCGAKFLVPAIEERMTPDAGTGTKPPPAEPKGSGVEVVTATSTKVRRAPKPKPKAKPAAKKPVTASGKSQPSPREASKVRKPHDSPRREASASDRNQPAPPPNQLRHKLAGARGGVAFYRERVRGRR